MCNALRGFPPLVKDTCVIDARYLAAGKNKCTSAPGSVRQHLVLDSCGWPEGDWERKWEMESERVERKTERKRKGKIFRVRDESKGEKLKEKNWDEMIERWSRSVRKRASDLHLLLIIFLAPSLVIAPSDITHSRPHFDYRWESMGGG